MTIAFKLFDYAVSLQQLSLCAPISLQLQSARHLPQFYSVLGVALAAYSVFWLYLYPAFFDPHRNLPGPTSNDLFLGSLEDIFRAERADKLVHWHGQSSPV